MILVIRVSQLKTVPSFIYKVQDEAGFRFRCLSYKIEATPPRAPPFLPPVPMTSDQRRHQKMTGATYNS
jgi:hypothetical protein